MHGLMFEDRLIDMEQTGQLWIKVLRCCDSGCVYDHKIGGKNRPIDFLGRTANYFARAILIEKKGFFLLDRINTIVLDREIDTYPRTAVNHLASNVERFHQALIRNARMSFELLGDKEISFTCVCFRAFR
jgi:hypothetical protein